MSDKPWLQNIVMFLVLVRSFFWLSIRYFIVYPAIALAVVLAISSELSFNKFFTEAYGYISKVSQLPAESHLHVNQEVCRTDLCDDLELKSVLIEDAATKSAEIATRIYLILVLFLMIADAGFRFVFFGSPTWLAKRFDHFTAKIPFLSSPQPMYECIAVGVAAQKVGVCSRQLTELLLDNRELLSEEMRAAIAVGYDINLEVTAIIKENSPISNRVNNPS